MRYRFLLLPSGTWLLHESADPCLLSEGTILLDLHEQSPARRMRVLRAGTWTALRESDVDRLWGVIRGR